MARSYHQLYIHFTFVTKYRDFLITDKLEAYLYKFLKEKCVELNLHLQELNGMSDHIHLLLEINPTSSIATIAKKLKGSSSRFMNIVTGDQRLFEWKRGYAAFTGIKGDLNRVKNTFTYKNSIMLNIQS